ncbi:hypothetical protein PILCRDRAFT_12073 [Piloderma croceum F 1598]|uniref:Uncharacterized protein n=1 Tax=Piloderma croceum (strain F 1598) TaxID=765440 RepID=A0A0C3BJ89_PILCF|nr:hypothetical protein PILCRDRAFT_12073 [Piloderma croceum F 1598]
MAPRLPTHQLSAPPATSSPTHGPLLDASPSRLAIVPPADGLRSGSDFGGEEIVTVLAWSLRARTQDDGRTPSSFRHHLPAFCHNVGRISIWRGPESPLQFLRPACSSAGTRSDRNFSSARLMRDAAHLVAERAWESREDAVMPITVPVDWLLDLGYVITTRSSSSQPIFAGVTYTRAPSALIKWPLKS